MSEQKETTGGKKRLTLSRPPKVELKKTETAGEVRQNFSHGRTKKVAVEVRRKRTFKQATDGGMTEVRTPIVAEKASPPAPAPVEKPKATSAALRTLTDTERAARLPNIV